MVFQNGLSRKSINLLTKITILCAIIQLVFITTATSDEFEILEFSFNTISILCFLLAWNQPVIRIIYIYSVFSIFLIHADTVRNCSQLLCEGCPRQNADICYYCKNLSMCSTEEKYFSYNKKWIKSKICVETCPINTYYKFINKDIMKKMCCEPCSAYCLDNCTGSSPYVEKEGCDKCYYGVFEESRGTFKCLEPFKSGNICSQNNYYNYYLTDSSDPTRTKYECKSCPTNCPNCTTSECFCQLGMEQKVFEDGTIKCVEKLSQTSNNQYEFPTLESTTEIKSFTHVISAITIILILIITTLCIVSYRKNGHLPFFHAKINNRWFHFNTSNIEANNFLNENKAEIIRSGYHGSGIRKQGFSRSHQKSSSISSFESISLPTPKSPLTSNHHSVEMFKTIPSSELKYNKSEENKLGEGNFGEVYKGIWKDQNVAIKFLKNTNPAAVKDAITYEAKTMFQFNHPYVQRLLGICLNDGFKLVTTLREGSLLTYLSEKHEMLTIIDLLLYCKQISYAIEFLHEKDIIHGDLAARNVLVIDKEHIEVSDLGLARNLDGTKGYTYNGPAPIQWLSPECLNTSVFNKENDIWALGVTAWEIFNYGLKRPYVEEKLRNLMELINFLQVEGRRLSTPNEWGVDISAALMLCWVEENVRSNITIIKQEFEKIYNSKLRIVSRLSLSKKEKTYRLN